MVCGTLTLAGVRIRVSRQPLLKGSFVPLRRMIGTLLPDLPVQQPPLQLLQPVRLQQPVWLRLVRLVHGIILRLLLLGNQKEDGKEQLRRLKVRLQSLVGTGD